MAGQRIFALVTLVALSLCVSSASAHDVASFPGCEATFGAGTHPFLFFADPGAFSGTGEPKYIIENMLNITDVSVYFPACGFVANGNLLRQRVSVGLTGIGPNNAVACVQQILDKCGDESVKNAIYMGTSGWSSAVGGVITPPMNENDTSTSCLTANRASAVPGRSVRRGDICVSPISMNWMCTKASWSQQCGSTPPGNQCFRPQNANGPDASFLYGQCFFVTPIEGSIELSEDILKVVTDGHFARNVPDKNNASYAQERKYWEITTNGTGIQWPVYNQSTAPTVFSRDTCVEVDGQFFYSGVPWEVTARDWAAEAIRTAGFNVNASASNVVAVAAMEAIGFMQALETFNRGACRPIPYTNIRSASNWLHNPVVYQGDGTWTDVMIDEDFANGYGFAIASYSSLILSYFQQRCLTVLNLDEPECTFTVDYA